MLALRVRQLKVRGLDVFVELGDECFAILERFGEVRSRAVVLLVLGVEPGEDLGLDFAGECDLEVPLLLGRDFVVAVLLVEFRTAVG